MSEFSPDAVEFNWQITDELIRQITLDSGDRGLMFLRVRDEIRMTMAAYETLFERGVAYGVRNALLFEEGKGDNEEQVHIVTVLTGGALQRHWKERLRFYLKVQAKQGYKTTLGN